MARTDERDRVRERLGHLRAARTEHDTEVAEPEGAEPDDERAGPATPDWLRFEPPPARSWVPERLRGARATMNARAVAVLAVVAVLAAVVAGFTVLADRPVAREVPPLPLVQADTLSPATSTTDVPVADDELVVSVVGLVQRSGLVRLPPGSRVADAIAAAGGAQDGADLLSLNMAQRVSDGDQILVGVAATDGGPPLLGSATVGAGGAGGGQTGGTTPAGKIDLNTATEAELDALPGVGPVTAAAIVAWRAANGPFTDVEQLGEVDGIGPSRLAKLRDLVTV